MRKILVPALLTVLSCSLFAPIADADRGTTSPVIPTTKAPAVDEDVAHDHAVSDDTDGRDVASSVSSVPSVSLRPSIVVEGGTAADRRHVDEALTRFADAGLMLPDLDIVFHDDRAGCQGHDGLFQRRLTPWRVLVCTDLDYVLTHELAHAWEAAHLDDAARQRYMDSRNLSTWNSPDASWGDRGVEDAAFMLQQNLMAGTVDPSSDRWVERTAAYAALTGHASPVAAPPPDVDDQHPLRARAR